MRKPLPLKKKILASLIRSAVIATVAMPAMSWAQSSDAGLRGKAPPEMQVTARNLDTGLRRTTTSAADGSYAIVGLPPGRYQVDAGPGTEKAITLTVASTASLDFTASGGAAAAPGTATQRARRLLPLLQLPQPWIQTQREPLRISPDSSLRSFSFSSIRSKAIALCDFILFNPFSLTSHGLGFGLYG